MIPISDFRHRLTLEAAEEIEDGAGGQTDLCLGRFVEPAPRGVGRDELALPRWRGGVLSGV
jgi:hypothetical protein